MEMINSYALTHQELEYLQKVKEETELEIAIRYLKSESNRNYSFPKSAAEEEDEIEEFPGRVSF
jgi:hypothetical protein